MGRDKRNVIILLGLSDGVSGPTYSYYNVVGARRGGLLCKQLPVVLLLYFNSFWREFQLY